MFQWFKLFLKRQIKTCQDCDQLRPFTVKRTCPAKTRMKTDIIEFFFSRGSMHGFGFQIDLKIFAKSQSRTACWQNSTEAGFLSNHKVQFWISVIWQVFSFGSPYCKMKISLNRFFCQIIMGSPLNDNVSKWRIVPLCLLPVPRLFHPFCLLAAKETGAHFYHSKYFTSIHHTANISIHYTK